ncbi:MAG: hypothetical protein Q7V57_17205, partial [Actinomycetota bacterium]|nr:hypothetical protein [Actinomycetota bacterium]
MVPLTGQVPALAPWLRHYIGGPTAHLCCSSRRSDFEFADGRAAQWWVGWHREVVRYGNEHGADRG